MISKKVDEVIGEKKMPIEMEARLEALGVYRSYKNSRYLSIKHSSYFQVYEELLGRFRGRPITFVEIGVLNGGSLFMWRDFFGPSARIIGIDLNPIARKWESDGFEIHIGSQSSLAFWDDFFRKVGLVDVILDDGGHTNEQQIVTTEKCIPHIKDGGLLMVEDTHASYLKEFGNPSKYSFINYCKLLLDGVNSRFPAVEISKNPSNQAIFSIAFYESIVCFNIDRTKCFTSSETSNEGIASGALDFRGQGSVVHGLIAGARRRLNFLEKGGIVRNMASAFATGLKSIHSKIESRKLRKYFK